MTLYTVTIFFICIMLIDLLIDKYIFILLIYNCVNRFVNR